MAPPLQHPLFLKGVEGEEVRIVVEDEAGDERRLSGRGTKMG
jgi:hypothetical protein